MSQVAQEQPRVMRVGGSKLCGRLARRCQHRLQRSGSQLRGRGRG